jgi:glutamyl-tRNA reductase
MNRLLLLGLNHTTAPLAVRERVALSRGRVPEVVAAFREKFPACEVVVLSTCNRTELYAARATHGHPRIEELIDFLATISGVPADGLKAITYHLANRGVVEHLFSVAASLDSMVVGETQILGQVRDAYDQATQLDTVGPQLHPLFQAAIAVGKQVMTDTPLAEGRVSVASVAVDYARQLFPTMADRTVLCVGAGEVGQSVTRRFTALRPRRVLVCNRDIARAQRLTRLFGGEALPLDRLNEGLGAADVVVTSTDSPQPLLTRSLVEPAMRFRHATRPIFLIDTAVPRDIEPAVGELAGVHLYDLDHLQSVVGQTHAVRQDAVATARKLISAHVDAFVAAARAREMGPTIDRLYRRYHAVAAEELQRTLGKLPAATDAERQHLEELTRRIVNKLLHEPVRQIRQSPEIHSPASRFLSALDAMLNVGDNGGDDDDRA